MEEIDMKQACGLTSRKISEIGLRVRAIRIGKKLTQQDLAFYCFMDKGLVSDLERGCSGNLTLLTLIRISMALGVSPEYLFAGIN